MKKQRGEATRDRAILIVRLGTAAGAAVAVGLAWLFSNLAVTFFSGAAQAAPPAPQVPVSDQPVQAAPPVVTTVIHHKGNAPAGGGAAPRPPSLAPGAPPAPPAAPVCHSTPSKPC